MHPSVRRDPQENTRCDAMRCDAMPAAKQGENSWQGGDGGGAERGHVGPREPGDEMTASRECVCSVTVPRGDRG